MPKKPESTVAGKRSQRDRTNDIAEQSIAEHMQNMVAAYLADASMDPVAFMEELPAAQRAGLIARHMPQAKNLDADLTASYISLSRALNEFKSPEFIETQHKLRALQLELKQSVQRADLLLELQRKNQAVISQRKLDDDHYRAYLKILVSMSENIHAFYRGKGASLVPLSTWKAAVEEACGRKDG